MKTLKQILDTYKLVITPLGDEDGPGFISRYEELGYSVRGIGSTPAEALAQLEDMALDGFEDVPVDELPIAASSTPWSDYNGRVTLRLPKMLHAKVSRQADEQGVSLNQWICHMLESGTTAVAAGCEFGARQVTGSEFVAQLGEIRQFLDQWSAKDSKVSPKLPFESSAKPRMPVMAYQHLELHVA